MALKIARLSPGDSISNNLNLPLGSAGFLFTEPGEYRITAVLTLACQMGRWTFERLVRSKPLRVRVSVPRTHEEERETLLMLEPDVGFIQSDLVHALPQDVRFGFAESSF